MKINDIICITLSVFSAVSCSFLEPETDNTRDESILDEAAYFCGPLNSVYNSLPTLFDNNMDVMTDNAVIRNQSGEYYRCAIGAMSPNKNPLDIWTNGYKNIRTLNVFMSHMVLNDDTEWRTPVRFFPFESEVDIENNLKMFWRLKGEAYAMRAYWISELLRNFGGVAEDGSVLGIPLVGDRILEVGVDDLDIPRATYEECIKAIIDDCDSATVACRLPDLYSGTDAVYGSSFRDHLSGAAAKAIKARALLYAASPAFNPEGDDAKKWEQAAVAAAEAIVAVGGINAAMSSRDEYYFTQINNRDWKNNDVIMRGKVVTGNRAFENDNYPPQLYGNALINVSQNFVEAFPDKNGYPITEDGTAYDPADPYANRDARLALFVGYNGGTIGSSNYKLNTVEGGIDAYDPLAKTSRSGYYLKKTLRMSVNLTPGAQTATPRANILYGLPELLLNYAEAANMAWGPSGDPEGYGFTAKDALRRILTRDNKAAGAKYLDEVIGDDRDKFNEYVRLQRRIELSFEGHYYYDLRRWYAADPAWESYINVPVNGVEITATGSGTEYKTVELEERYFASPYQPIPYSEVYNAGIVQNKGWQ